jgi:hypothetical protein
MMPAYAISIAAALFAASAALAAPPSAQPAHPLSGQSVPAIITFPAGETPSTPQPPAVDGFIVAPTGDDNGTGTVDAPFRTLARCQAAMRGPGTRSTAKACMCAPAAIR